MPPIPPEVTITAWARNSNSPTAVRDDGAPRGTSLFSSTVPDTPSTAPLVRVSASTRCLKPNSMRPVSAAARTRRSNGSTTPGPVPQVMWNRGTLLPTPLAKWPPRSAHPTTGTTECPIAASHARFSPAAHST